MYTCNMLVKYWRAKRARKNDNNKVYTTVGPPPLPHKTSIQDPTSDKFQGGGGFPDPRSPLWIRACCMISFLFVSICNNRCSFQRFTRGRSISFPSEKEVKCTYIFMLGDKIEKRFALYLFSKLRQKSALQSF